MPTRRPPSYHPLDRSPFHRLGTKARLAALLGVDPAKLRRLARGDGSLYREWDDVTPKGKVRHIENPEPALKRAQARIAALLSRIEPPDYLFCPVKGRSYIDNAGRHADGAVIRTLDIKDYFASTPSRRVYWFFRERLECAEDVAAVLARLSTIDGHLPTGSPLSPVLSFYAHLDMWEEIARAAREAGCVLSVYMDDVTISGSRVPDRLIWRVRQEVRRCGLKYHKEKRYERRPAEVTGIIVHDGGIALPNAKHKALHETRRDFRLAVDPETKARLHRVLMGREGQLAQVRAYAHHQESGVDLATEGRPFATQPP